MPLKIYKIKSAPKGLDFIMKKRTSKVCLFFKKLNIINNVNTT